MESDPDESRTGKEDKKMMTQIRNEFTGEVIETRGRRRFVRWLVERMMKENRAAGAPSRSFFKSIPTEGLRVICVEPNDHRLEWHLRLIPGDN